MSNQQPENNILINFEDYSLKQLRETAYHFSLRTLIENEFYPYIEKAKSQGWVLGKLHEEWDELLNEWQCLNIIAPRDHLKTFFFSEAFPLRFAKENPKSRIQIYRKTTALGVETLDKIKRWAELPYFKDLLVNGDLNNKTQLRFGNGTEIFVGGFDTAGRGGHPDLIILDDVIDTDVVYSDDLNAKSKERLASEIMPMAEPHTRIIVIGTVQREDDLYSIDWAKLEADDGTIAKPHWFSKTYDAIVDEEKKMTLFPEKWTWEALMKRKREIVAVSGLQWFLKEYRNIAVKKGGAIIKPEWIKHYKQEDLPKNIDVYTGWDLSTGKKLDEGDWTAKCSIGVNDKGDIYVLRGMYRARIDFGGRVRALIDEGVKDKPKKIRVENNTFQNDTVKTAQKNSALPIEGITTTQNKIRKFREEVAPLFENGKVCILDDDPVQKIFVEELLSCPNGKHDDTIDAFHLATKDIPFLHKASDYAIVV